jgi:hypothetical protein
MNRKTTLAIHGIFLCGILLWGASCKGIETVELLTLAPTSTPTAEVIDTSQRYKAMSTRTASPSPTPLATTTIMPTESSKPTPTATSYEAVRLDASSPNQVRAMLIDNEGNLWTGGPGGVTWNGGPGLVVRWDFETGNHRVYTPEDGLANAFVVSITQTGDGAIWVGTFGEGVSRFDGQRWQTFTTDDGLPSNYIMHVFTSSDGKLWINPYRDPMEEGYFGRFDGQHWNPVAGGGWDSVVVSPDGSFWMNDFELGISKFVDNAWVESDETNIKFWNEHIVALNVAPDGEVWAATALENVYKYDGFDWEKVSIPWTEENSSFVTSIAFSTDGTVWLGFSYPLGLLDRCGSRDIYQAGKELGIYRYDGKIWKQFTIEDGLADNKVCAMVPGPDGSMWVGTFDKGVSHFDGETWTNYEVTNFKK